MSHPLVYFWVAEFNDGKALAQFDPESGIENRFNMVDQKRLKRFGWHPFSARYSNVIYNTPAHNVTVPSLNQSYTVEPNGHKLVAYRENIIKIFKFWHCGKHSDKPPHAECGFNWMFQDSAPHPLIGLPYGTKAFIEEVPTQDQRGKRVVKIVNPVCPKCGWHDVNGPNRLRVIREYSDERRAITYVLGVHGGKVIRIREDGTLDDGSEERLLQKQGRLLK